MVEVARKQKIVAAETECHLLKYFCHLFKFGLCSMSEKAYPFLLKQPNWVFSIGRHLESVSHI